MSCTDLYMSVQFCLASGTVLWSLQALSCTDLYSLYKSVMHLLQVLTPVTVCNRTPGTGLQKLTGSVQVCSMQ